LLLAAALCGCGSDLDLGEVQGVVKLDGKPLPNAVVTFTPKGGGPAGVGKTNAEGEYQLMTVDQLGAVIGEHTVSIIAVPEPTAVAPSSGHGGVSETGIDTSSATYKPPPVPKVPERYNAKTELTEKVESGSNTIDFDLKP
jgi:hypothetical protein